jgi:hypothetical protein
LINQTSDVFHFSVSFKLGSANESGSRLHVDAHRMFDFERHQDDRGIILLWGAPSLDGKLIDAAAMSVLFHKDGIEKTAQRLDHSFIIVVHRFNQDRLNIVTDRLGSLPFFITTQNGAFVASNSFKSLFDNRGAGSSATLDLMAVGEFLYFRRLFGTRTYDTEITYLPQATILTVDADGTRNQRRYRALNADKLTLSHDAMADRLAGALQRSMQVQMSSGRPGLLLSGGLDARALLAASPRALPCFTTALKRNNEVDVAAQLAALRHAEHIFLPRPVQLLNEALVPAIRLGGGMTVFHEAQFLGYGPGTREKADTLLIGLGLDIMFGALYSPKSTARFLGQSGWHYRLHSLPDDIATHFINNISYRLKTSDPLRVVHSDHKDKLKVRLRDAVQQELGEGAAFGLRGYDLWEFMHIRNFARHYSLLMAQSVRTFAACRIPAFSNDLYDLSWAMRVEDKYNWGVYQKAISRLNPEMMRVVNSNTNIRADTPLPLQSAVKFKRAILRRFGFAQQAAPSWWDRSWPEPRQSIDVNPKIHERVAMLSTSPRLAATGLFDLEAIEMVHREHASRSADHTILLNVLITLDEALRQPDESVTRK